jgi:hypothetical protein
MKAKFVYEKFKEGSDPVKDMGIGLNKWEVIFDEYDDGKVAVNQKFDTKKDAIDFVADCEYDFEDEVYDENGNEMWKTITRWYNPEDKETYFGYDIREISN